MTLGITGVFWLPRTATVNSTTLWAGAGPVPLGTAAPAWTQIAAAYTDASLTLTRVLAELAVGWQGVTASAALARVTGFKIWADQAAATATVLATKSAANSIASTTARVVMPSLPEIAAVQAAKVAAYSTGGVLNGTAEAAEAADRALDIRAALVMEAYEAATTTVVATPTEFVPPPQIANGSGATSTAEAGQEGDSAVVDPVHPAGMAAAAFLQNPAVQTAASQAGQIAGSVASTAVSTATNVGTSMLSASAATAATPGAAMPLVGAPISGLSSAATPAANATRSVAYSGPPTTNVVLPEGWATGTPVGATPGTSAPATTATTPATFTPVDPNAARSGPLGPLAGHPRAGGTAQDDEHETPEYLRKFEHFADGRTVVPAVIGAEPAPAR